MYIIPLTVIADKLNSVFGAFDMFFFKLFGNIQSDFLTSVEKGITFFGDGKFVAVVLVAALVMLLFKKTRKVGLCVITALVLSTLVTNLLLKPVIMRPRPYVFLKDNLQFMTRYENAGALVESDFSFPSGHTTAAFSYCTAMFLSLKGKHKWAYALPLLAVLVMVSRVYLMVHFASDVLFGMLVGVLCAAVGYYLSGLFQKIIGKTPLDKFDLKERAAKLK